MERNFNQANLVNVENLESFFRLPKCSFQFRDHRDFRDFNGIFGYSPHSFFESNTCNQTNLSLFCWLIPAQSGQKFAYWPTYQPGDKFFKGAKFVSWTFFIRKKDFFEGKTIKIYKYTVLRFPDIILTPQFSLKRKEN